MKFLLFAAMSVFSLSNAALSATQYDEWKCTAVKHTELLKNKKLLLNKRFIGQKIILRTESYPNGFDLYVVDGHLAMLEEGPFVRQNDDNSMFWDWPFDMRLTRHWSEQAFLKFNKRIDFTSPTKETKQYLNVTLTNLYPSKFYDELVMDCEVMRSWKK